MESFLTGFAIGLGILNLIATANVSNRLDNAHAIITFDKAVVSDSEYKGRTCAELRFDGDVRKNVCYKVEIVYDK